MLVRMLSVVLLVVVFISACSLLPVADLSPPPDLGDGLETASPADVGLDPAHLQAAIDAIEAGDHGEIHAMLIYSGDKLVVERYWPGHDYQWDAPGHRGDWVAWDAHTRHIVHSVGKSITSACVGIAIDQGLIQSVGEPIWRYLPDYQHLATDGKHAITVEHLLTMTSGLDWDEWSVSYGDERNDIIGMWVADDPVAFILSKPLLTPPGETFTYNGGGMVLLAEIVRNATGMHIEAYAGEHLFAPLGIDTPPWSWINDSVIYGGGDQRLTPREMLTFGVLYLNGGMWQDERILPEAWVEASATPYDGPESTWRNGPRRAIPPDDKARGQRGYSYAWWCHTYRRGLRRVPVYSATGWAGQRIIVFPEHDTVVVFTASNYNAMDASVEILQNHIIPALP